jgi:hypothetical protein
MDQTTTIKRSRPFPRALPRRLLPIQGKPGTGTGYRAEFIALARGAMLLGATTEALAALFDVSVNTIDNWRAKHRAFDRAVREGGEWADAQVANGLYRRASGFMMTTTTSSTTQTRDTAGNVTGTTTTTTTTESEVPPHVGACLKWLHLRQGWDVNATRTVFTMADVLSVLEATKAEMRRRGLVGREGMTQALEDVQRRSRPRCPECGAMMFGPVDDDDDEKNTI